MKKFSTLFVFILMMLLGASCIPIQTFNIEVNMKQADKWDATATLVLAREAGTSTAQELARSLDQMKTEIEKNDGASMDWKQNPVNQAGNFPFQINLRSVSPEVLNDSFFGNNTFSVREVNGERRVSFQLIPSYSMAIREFTITLKGKKVISTNGQKIDDSTTRWVNPRGQIQAEVIEGTPGIPPAVVIGLLVVVAAAGAIWYFLRTRRRVPAYQPYPTYPSYQPTAAPTVVIPLPQNAAQPSSTSGEDNFCSQCGYCLPAGAQFCPNCGAKRESSTVIHSQL